MIQELEATAGMSAVARRRGLADSPWLVGSLGALSFSVFQSQLTGDMAVTEATSRFNFKSSRKDVSKISCTRCSWDMRTKVFGNIEDFNLGTLKVSFSKLARKKPIAVHTYAVAKRRHAAHTYRCLVWSLKHWSRPGGIDLSVSSVPPRVRERKDPKRYAGNRRAVCSGCSQIVERL
jgi:hypothetical protein